MYQISPNFLVTLHRGDTFEYPLFINVGSKIEPVRYNLTADDSVFFAIMEPNQPFEHALIRKKLTVDDLNENGDVVLRLSSTDTEFLLPGTYYYEIKLGMHIGEAGECITTLVEKRKFTIVE